MLKRKLNRRTDGLVLCFVHLPNDQAINLTISLQATGADLWDDVVEALCMPEKDFFGLKLQTLKAKTKNRPWTSSKSPQHIGYKFHEFTWLRFNRKLMAELGMPEPYTQEQLPSSVQEQNAVVGTWHVYVAVRFYVGPDVTSNWSQPAKELLFHQLLLDIGSGRLKVPIDLNIVLCAYALHVLEGDYNLEKHAEPSYIDNYRFISCTDTEVTRAIQQHHRQCRGMISTSDALTEFTKICQYLEDYGVVHQHAFQYDMPILLGTSPRGFSAYKDNKRLYAYSWFSLKSLNISGKNLDIIFLNQDESKDPPRALSYELPSATECKEFWEAAIANHTFFFRESASSKGSATTLRQALENMQENSRKLHFSGRSTTPIHLPGSGISIGLKSPPTKDTVKNLIQDLEGKPQLDKKIEWSRRGVLIAPTTAASDGFRANRGDIVEIIDATNHDWWLVKAGNDIGHVPARTVKEFFCQPHHVVEACQDFVSNEFAFNKGDVLFLIKELEDQVLVSTGYEKGNVTKAAINFNFVNIHADQ